MKRFGEWIKKKIGLYTEPKLEMKMERVLCQNAQMNAGPKPMTNAEREKITKYLKGMTHDELKIVANNIPIELCHNRIGEELKNFKRVKSRQKEMSTMLEKELYQ